MFVHGAKLVSQFIRLVSFFSRGLKAGNIVASGPSTTTRLRTQTRCRSTTATSSSTAFTWTRVG